GAMVRGLGGTGVLLPRGSRWIGAGAWAAVQQVAREPGAGVEADTVMVDLVNPELEAGVERARAALAGAEAEVAAARTSLRSQLLDQQAQLAQAEAEWRSAEVRAQAHGRAHEAGVLATIELRQSEIEEEQRRHRASI